jgi:hypothetical protein
MYWYSILIIPLCIHICDVCRILDPCTLIALLESGGFFSALERDTGIIEKTNSTSTYGLRWESNYGYWIMEKNIFVMFTCTGESPGGLYMWFLRLFAYRNASAAGSG